ncbi:hypothetical protein LL946_08190 [Knoellia locipacati]|uniref:hypothetical protein n=1 Tax=Knoellia locipacati TaxID=882824 RepID=UPI00384CB94C
MSTPATSPWAGSARAGTVALVAGAVTLAATAFTYVLSLSDVIDPPNWLRILGIVWMPLGFVATPILCAVARLGPGRQRAGVGLALALAGLVAFVVLLFVAG